MGPSTAAKEDDGTEDDWAPAAAWLPVPLFACTLEMCRALSALLSSDDMAAMLACTALSPPPVDREPAMSDSILPCCASRR